MELFGVRLTDVLEDVSTGGGHLNRSIRLKYLQPRDHLDEAMLTRARQGNLQKRCPICEYYQANLDRPVQQVEFEVMSNPEFGVVACCESIFQATIHNNRHTHEFGDLIATAVQWDGALALYHYHPWERVRGPLETLLRHPKLRFARGVDNTGLVWGWQAPFVLCAMIIQNHPNPRKFLEQDVVRSKLPAEWDLSTLPAPDFD